MRTTFLAVLGLLSALPALADPLALRLQHCRAERDPARRLACYDELPLPAVAAAVAPPNKAPQPPTASVTPPTPVPADRFGLPAPAVAAPAQPEAIESELEGRFTGWMPGTRLRLRNGQVWQIADESNAAYDLMQPKARIEKGRFGSYFLRVEGVGPTPRVRRLQ